MATETSNRTTNGFIGFISIFVLLFAVVVVAVAVLGFSHNGREGVEERRAAARNEIRKALETEAQDKLNSEGWIDKAKGLVHVSITDAIPLTAKELQAKKAAPSKVEVEPPLPVFVPDPNATEPPPPALPSAPQGAETIRFTAPATPAPAAAPAAAPAPAPAAPATPAPAPAAPAPAPVPAPEVKPAAAPAPAAPVAPASEAPARAPLINPTENPAPAK